MRLQSGLILYDPVEHEVIKVLMPHVEPVIVEVVLDPWGEMPRYEDLRAYRLPDRDRWEPCPDELFARYELAESARANARAWADDAT